MMDSEPTPNISLVKNSLQFFWLVDYSGSMTGLKIATLNQAIREAIPEVRNAVATHPEVQIFMRAIKFADDANWHGGAEPVKLEDYTWEPLGTDGCTSTAAAIRLLASELTREKMGGGNCPPVAVLISDGHHTDSQEEYDTAIADLRKLDWGKKLIRVVIAIGGKDSDYDSNELLKFVSPELRQKVGLIEANSVEELVHYIKWAATELSVSSSLGKSQMDDADAYISVNQPEQPVLTDSNEPF